MTLSLIVNADDFGLTEGVNEAVLACHQAGSVTSTTLMVNMAAAAHAADIARRHPSLGVGLHFNLTDGSPVAPAATVPSLVDSDGRFLRRGELLRRSLLGQLRPADVETELRAQLGRMRTLGAEPTHFDSHQHVHALPHVFAALSGAAAAEGLPLRMTWRWLGRVGGKPWRRRLSEGVLGAMTRRRQAELPQGVPTNDGLCSVFDLSASPEQLTESSYEQLLAPYSDGWIELMVHPAVVDEELQGKTAITRVSAVENRLLRSAFLPRYVESRGGRMATYRELARHPDQVN